MLDHVVFADADHERRARCYADTLEQLGYGAENGTWRNFYLSGATELREGNFGTPTVTAAPAILAQLTPEQLFDASHPVNGPKAWDLDLRLGVTSPISHGVPRHPRTGADHRGGRPPRRGRR